MLRRWSITQRFSPSEKDQEMLTSSADSDLPIDVNNPGAIVAACLLSAVGTLVFNLMPLFLGSAAESLGFNDQQVGFVASVYLGGFTLTSFSAVFWSRNVGWHKACLVAIVVAVISYLGCLFWPDYLTILILISLAGCAKGALFAISLCSLGDTRIPDRAFGLALLAQVALGALGLFLLPYVVRGWGFNSILVALIIVTALVVGLLRWLPNHGLKEEAALQSRKSANAFPVFVGLAGLLLMMTGLTGVWAFLERVGTAGALETSAIGTVLSLTLVAGAVAALLVSWLGDRFGRAIPLFLGTAVMLVAIAFLAGKISLLAFAIGGVLLMGGWTAVYAYQMAAISAADTSGKFVPLIAAAAGLGSALGPGVAGSLISGEDFTNVYLLGAGCLLASLVLFLWLIFRPKVSFSKVVNEKIA